MSRQKRKLRADIKFKNRGGLLDAFDNAVKSAWYINDDEYNYICKFATKEELDLFLGGNGTFSDMKKALIMVDNLLEEYENRDYKSTQSRSIN